jgi:hypothetical protein
VQNLCEICSAQKGASEHHITAEIMSHSPPDACRPDNAVFVSAGWPGHGMLQSLGYISASIGAETLVRYPKNFKYRIRDPLQDQPRPTRYQAAPSDSTRYRTQNRRVGRPRSRVPVAFRVARDSPTKGHVEHVQTNLSHWKHSTKNVSL